MGPLIQKMHFSDSSAYLKPIKTNRRCALKDFDFEKMGLGILLKFLSGFYLE